MTFDVAAEFGRCWDADECTMDPACMLHDNCLATEEEMADASRDDSTPRD